MTNGMSLASSSKFRTQAVPPLENEIFYCNKMMELSHSLLLNEEAISQLQDEKKPVFVYEWLRFLNRVLPVAQKSDIKGCQQKLVQQLNNQIACCQNPASRKLLARCLAVLFSVGDTYSLFQTINFCNDLIKNKDDSPSFLPARLNAVCCLGAMYEKLGRMVGRSYEETAQLLIKSLKNSESQGRMEIMNTFRKMTLGLGTAAGSIIRKDIYKAARLLLTDRSLSVRCAAANCLTELTKQGQFSFNQELDNLVSSCLKALDGSNYEVRRTIATLLGTILAYGHYPKLFGKLGPGSRINSPDSQTSSGATSVKPLTLEDCWTVLASGFLKGAMGFYRNGSAPVSTIQAEVRVGMAMAYIQFLNILGPSWLERNSLVVLIHLLDLAASSSRSGSSNLPVFDCMHIRTCVCYIIRRTFGTILKEQAQIAVCKELGHLVAEQMNAVDLSMDSSMTRSLAYEHAASQQIIVVALLEMSRLVGLVGGSATPLFVEASGVLEAVFSVLNHPCLPSRMASAWCLSRAAIVIPSLLTALVDRCIARIEHQKTSYDAISGYSLCIATLLSAIHKSQLGVPQDKHKKIFALAEDFIKTASQTSRLTLIKTQSGWLLISALMSLGAQAIRHHLPKIQLLWKNAFPRSAKEADNEKQRGDAFTWQYFVLYCKELLTDDVLKRIYISLETTLITLGYISPKYA
uniref:HEAT repeat-containing protein 5B n=1 Tax=Romanomermis culicivorax TaxID=13658 RepID=A0A915KZA4_ROMCU